MVEPPDGGQPRRSTGRPDQSRPAAVLTPREAEEGRLAPGEKARIDEAIVRVARRDRGPTVAAALVAGAFLLGLVRPWDWLTGGAAAVPSRPAEVAGIGRTSASPYAGVAAVPSSARTDGERDPGSAAPTCAYPSAWRTATIQMWAGARARVWTAAEAVVATGVDDPSIPFNPIPSDSVEAIGWCAPVTGPDRPPLTAEATLFRLVGGVATEVVVDRLEPPARDALGELWLPQEQAGGRRPLWAPGRYVIRLAAPSGGYERFLGMQVGLPELRPEPLPTAEPSAARTAEPSATGSTPEP